MALKLRSMMKKHKWLRIIFWLVVVVLLFRLGYLAYQKYQDYSPIEKSKPQYYMTVKGHIDPALLGNFQLYFTENFETTNDECVQSGGNVLNWVEGAVFPYEEEVSYPIKINSTGYFEIKVPLDRFKNRRCKWKLVSIDYAMIRNDKMVSTDPRSGFGFGKPQPLIDGTPNEVKKATEGYNALLVTPKLQHVWVCQNVNCTMQKGPNFRLEFVPIQHNIEFDLIVKKGE